MVELLNVFETAERLRLSPQTVRRFVASGELPCVRLGDRVLVRAEDLTEFVSRNVRTLRTDQREEGSRIEAA
jgi:excisionase family DNA binding protein